MNIMMIGSRFLHISYPERMYKLYLMSISDHQMTTFPLNEYFANAGTDVLHSLITYRKSDRNEEHHTRVAPRIFGGGAT